MLRQPTITENRLSGKPLNEFSYKLVYGAGLVAERSGGTDTAASIS
jgi:hypothetical protein